MKKEKYSQLVNYLFSLGFILLLIIIFLFMSYISKFVFSDNEAIKEHVISTREIFEEIGEVKRTTEILQESNNVSKKNEYDTYEIPEISPNKLNYKIIDIAHVNINDSKSFMTIQLDRKIYTFENMYYIQIKNSTELSKADPIIYLSNSDIYEGTIITSTKDITNEKTIHIINSKTKTIDEIEYKDILGKIIAEK